MGFLVIRDSSSVRRGRKYVPRTMQQIYEKYNFSASPRKWKMVLKDWKFEKHLSEREMKIVVAKAEKRRQDGKETVFVHHGSEIPTEKIQNFKRRKTVKQSEVASPSAATPPGIAYHTPRCEDHDSPVVDQMDNIPEELGNLQLLDPLIEPTDVSEVPWPAVDYLKVIAVNKVVGSDVQLQTSHPSASRTSHVTIDTANDAESSGDSWKEHGNDAIAAIKAYEDAIKQFSRLEGPESLPVRRIRTKLASIQTTQKQNSQAISNYRKAIFGYVKKTGEDSFYTIQNTEKLAGVLCLEREYHEAERLYWRAARGYLKIGQSVPSLQCLLAIAEIYRQNRLYKEELETLHGTLVENLKLLFDIHHAMELEEIAVVLVTSPLKKAYSRLGRHGFWDTIIAKLTYMGKHLYANSDSFAECLRDIMQVAELYSRLFEFTTAESIFRIAITRLEKPTDRTEDKVKTTIFLSYCSHLDRRGDFASCQSALSVVANILRSILLSHKGTDTSLALKAIESIQTALSASEEIDTASALGKLSELFQSAVQLSSC